MKRSSQVALVLMGVTATTAAGAYMMPPRPECRQPAASTVVNPAAALPQGATPAAAQGEQSCRRRRWGTWRWSSGSYYSDRSRPLFSNRAPTSVSTALSPASRSTSTGTSASRSGSTGTSRGGFGSTGHSMSGHSGGS